MSLRRCGRRLRASLAASNVAAPEISAQEKQAGAINIASSSQAPAKPLLPVNPMSAPRAAAQKTETNAAAPEIGGRAGDSETLIALSATPAPVAPPPAIPAGNLSARVSISPDGPKPGTPGGTASGNGRGRKQCRRRRRPRSGRHFHQRRKQRKHRSDFRAGHRAGVARKRQCAALAAGSARAHRARGLEIAIRGCGRGRSVRSEIGIVSAGSARLETRLHAAREYAEFDERVRQLDLEFCRAE